jgi:hypothetical protein
MSMETLSSGTGEFRFTDPDVIRAWTRDHKRRDFLGLIRGIIRQGRRNLSYCAKFTLMESTLLAAAGAVARIDVDRTIIGGTAEG